MAAQERPVRILSLDGGGVRGLSSIMIIRRIMRGVNGKRGPDDQLEPCQVFDMIGGTSTGGIIAIMLGRLRMKLSDCEDAYLQLSEKIFTPKRIKSNIFGQVKDLLQAESRFDAKVLESSIKEYINELEDGDEDILLKDPGSSCSVFVVTTRENNSEPAILRSYQNPSKVDMLYDECRVWEACRATSAATTFFDPIVIGKFGQKFIDGGLLYNNPIDIAYQEAETIWPSRDILILSIGTGSAPGKPFRGNLKAVAERMKNVITQTERTANDFYNNHPALVAKGLLFRFNVDQNLSQIGLNEYEEKSSIADATQVYLDRGEINMKLSLCIDKLSANIPKDLVDVRPARVRKVETSVSASKKSSFDGHRSEVESTPRSQKYAKRETKSGRGMVEKFPWRSKPAGKNGELGSVSYYELSENLSNDDLQVTQLISKKLPTERDDGSSITAIPKPWETILRTKTIETDASLDFDSTSTATSPRLNSKSQETNLSADSLLSSLDRLRSAQQKAHVELINSAKSDNVELLLAWISKSDIRSKLDPSSINAALIELCKNIELGRQGVEAVRVLLDKCTPDLEYRDTKYGNTPLIWAVYFRHWAIAKLLISKNAYLEAVDRTYERTPLLWAASRGSLKATELLLENSQEGQLIGAKDKDGNTALALAYDAKHMPIAKALLHHGADPNISIKPGLPLLISAIGDGDEGFIRLLIVKGANVNCISLDGVPALSVAVKDRSLDMIQMLIDHGADVQASDRHGRTPLGWAIRHSRYDVKKLLITKGLDKI